MNNYTKHLFIVAIFLMFNNIASAADKAIKINIGSNGAGNVSSTIASVRQLIGHAVGSGVIDNFIVTFPKEGEPIATEGGLAVCAEAGFGIVPSTDQEELHPQLPGSRNKFDILVNQLRSIQPDQGVFLNITLAEKCGISVNDDPVDEFPICGGIAGLICPNALICIDDPRDNCDPKKGGADCIGTCVPKR
ncbi:MAG: hypothetical protein KAH20_14000 [Methylococcales bacterium]|nr:hypothetical protein [Methylococcales bacterium]